MRRKAGAILSIERQVLDAGLAMAALGAPEFHGYMLAKEMRDMAGARRLVGHGTLYKALDRLEAAGLLASRWEDANAAALENRPRRRLYKVTAAGSAALASLPAREAASAPSLREELMPG